MYVLVPMPYLFFGASEGGGGGYGSSVASGWVDAGKFLTGFSAVGSFAIPAILYHSQARHPAGPARPGRALDWAASKEGGLLIGKPARPGRALRWAAGQGGESGQPGREGRLARGQAARGGLQRGLAAGEEGSAGDALPTPAGSAGLAGGCSSLVQGRR